MIVWKKILAAVTTFLPSGLVLNTGASTALVVIALFLALMLWQAVTKGLADAVTTWLKEHARGLLLFVYGFPVLACLIAGSLYSAAAMAVVAAVALLLQRTRRLRWRVGGLIALQILLLSSALFLESRLRERQNRAENERLQVYVVLPLEPRSGEDLQKMLSLSRTLRDMVEDVFGDLVKVRVEPGAYSEVKDLDDWKKMKAVVKRLSQEGLDPDIVLVNGVVLTPADLLALSIQLKTCSPTTADLSAMPGVSAIQQGGRLEHFPYLVLRASLQMFERVAESKRFDLGKAGEERVRLNVLRGYYDLLLSDIAAPREVVQATESALSAKVIAPAALRKLVAAYPEDETGAVKEMLAAKTRSRLGALGQPVVLASDAPAPPAVAGTAGDTL